jgi:tRNA threonylcarbamoyladenosine biosynthesis protein TsaE
MGVKFAPMQLLVTIDGLAHFAEQFWKVADGATVFAFHGAMGAGKTTTISALCRYKGVHDALSSPTFSIINEYSFTEQGNQKKIFHIDLYRLKDEEEVQQTGVEDCVDSGEICFVEWPEKAPYLFDEKALHIVIEPVSQTERRIKILTAAAYKQHSITEQS